MVNNSTNKNKTNNLFSPHRNELKERTTTYGVSNRRPGLGQGQTMSMLNRFM